ncbi:TatD family hydrolase [Candidatus Dependentiae bacterium]|nr:TatD family hydrolase [Candidatus Dependentiae bacterium]
MLIDTHCHMNILVRNFDNKEPFKEFNTQEIELMEKIIFDAEKQLVTQIINVGTDYTESYACIEIAKIFSNCFAAIGLHPNDITDTWQNDILNFRQLLLKTQENKIVGIGECGIDKHYPNYDLKQQQEVFHAQIQLALEHNLAIIVHSRDADEETYNVISQYYGEKNFRGTIHCFSSNEKYAQKYIDLGFVLGFGGTITYPKNEILRSVAKMIPLEKIILETDAPFLSPQIVRGSKNNPTNIKIIAEYIAKLRQEDFKNVMQTTTKTTKNLFGIL